MKTSESLKCSIRFNLSVYNDDKGGYNAHRAFSRMNVDSVNYKILDLIRKNDALTRKEINKRVGMSHGVNENGYRSTTFARMAKDDLIIYNHKNHGYDLTVKGLAFLAYAAN